MPHFIILPGNVQVRPTVPQPYRCTTRYPVGEDTTYTPHTYGQAHSRCLPARDLTSPTTPTLYGQRALPHTARSPPLHYISVPFPQLPLPPRLPPPRVITPPRSHYAPTFAVTGRVQTNTMRTRVRRTLPFEKNTISFPPCTFCVGHFCPAPHAHHPACLPHTPCLLPLCHTPLLTPPPSPAIFYLPHTHTTPCTCCHPPTHDSSLQLQLPVSHIAPLSIRVTHIALHIPSRLLPSFPHFANHITHRHHRLPVTFPAELLSLAPSTHMGLGGPIRGSRPRRVAGGVNAATLPSRYHTCPTLLPAVSLNYPLAYVPSLYSCLHHPPPPHCPLPQLFYSSRMPLRYALGHRYRDCCNRGLLPPVPRTASMPAVRAFKPTMTGDAFPIPLPTVPIVFKTDWYLT